MLNLRRLALASCVLFLAACGFSPIYGSHGKGSSPVSRQLSSVQIENIPDRNGQMLRNKLIDRMHTYGRPAKPEARLEVSMGSTESAMGIQKDATTSRSQLSMTASFKLTDMNGKILHQGGAHAVASYSKLDAQYGTLASQRDAYDRAINEIGEQIVNNIALYYAEKAPYQTKADKASAE